jgi:ribonuclease BN (tRNA processing enzyme)
MNFSGCPAHACRGQGKTRGKPQHAHGKRGHGTAFSTLVFFAMKLLFLGTSGYHPTERRQTSCLLLPECGVVLDAGTGMFRLGRYLQTEEADIFLTHAHLDHSTGLTYLFSVLMEHPLKRLTIHGEAEKLKGIMEHLFSEPLFPVRPPWEFQVLEKQRSTDFQSVEKTKPLENLSSETTSGLVANLPHGGRLTYFPLEHPGGTIGFRLDWPGRSMAYVTDTTADPQAAYVKEIASVDLLVHECYYPDARADLAVKYGHSSLSAVAEVARAAQVGKLILTHFDPLHPEGENLDLAAARRIFSQIGMAEDLQEVVF